MTTITNLVHYNYFTRESLRHCLLHLLLCLSVKVTPKKNPNNSNQDLGYLVKESEITICESHALPEHGISKCFWLFLSIDEQRSLSDLVSGRETDEQ